MDRGTPLAGSPASHGNVSHRGRTQADFDAWIRRYNADLQPTSLAYRAAVILLAGREFGHNIDRIAGRTGYPRPLVSQVARRLIDNGVWNAGVTVADWTGSEQASASFWNDVAVGEGRMCRRIGPAGKIEWAPAGFWNKSFQFVDPEADNSLSALYHDAGGTGTGETGESGDPETGLENDDAPELPEFIGLTPAAADRDEFEPAVELIGGRNGSNGNGTETEIIGPVPAMPGMLPAAAHGRTTVPALDDLFSNAVWIG